MPAPKATPRIVRPERAPERHEVAAESLRKLLRKPAPEKKAAARLAGLVDFAVSARDERLEIAQDFGRGGEGGNAQQIGRGAVVEIMKAAASLQRKAQVGILLDPVEQAFEFVPMRTLGGDELLEIENHRSCRLFHAEIIGSRLRAEFLVGNDGKRDAVLLERERKLPQIVPREVMREVLVKIVHRGRRRDW